MNKYQVKGAVVAVAIGIGLGLWQGWLLGLAWIVLWVASEAFEHFATKPKTK
ncbi:hypothetical protein [Pseudomonas syringae pv. coryli]|uniref:hypothetical protein n=1 Tax=Pseudomonas syringae pv. coryli TaxID=317659 RepID=UPI003D2C5593